MSTGTTGLGRPETSMHWHALCLDGRHGRFGTACQWQAVGPSGAKDAAASSGLAVLAFKLLNSRPSPSPFFSGMSFRVGQLTSRMLHSDSGATRAAEPPPSCASCRGR